METTRNELPYKLKRFLDKMKTDLDTQFYYYGSIQRNDYIEGKSDIDICIFTDNETSMITRVAHFLHVPKTEFKRFIKRTTTDSVYGYKVKYKTTETNDKNELIKSEITIYNTRFKNIAMDHYHKTINAPIFILSLLFILKHLYHTFNFISKERYKEIKNYIFDELYLNLKGRSFFLLY